MNKNLRLFQDQPNACFYTYDVIFDDLTGKQIFNGIEIATKDGISKGIYNYDNFMRKCHEFWRNDEFVYSREIHSYAEPLKKTIKKERQKMTRRLRFTILKRDGYKCKLCGSDSRTTSLTVDHIIPISKGGKTEFQNLQCLCFECNSGKSNIL